MNVGTSLLSKNLATGWMIRVQLLTGKLFFYLPPHPGDWKPLVLNVMVKVKQSHNTLMEMQGGDV
jgi:hypothetical protein